MPRRNLKHRKTTLQWTSDDEPYNEAAFRVFVELFRCQHDEPDELVARACDELEALAEDNRTDFDPIVLELVRRLIERQIRK